MDKGNAYPLSFRKARGFAGEASAEWVETHQTDTDEGGRIE